MALLALLAAMVVLLAALARPRGRRGRVAGVVCGARGGAGARRNGRVHAPRAAEAAWGWGVCVCFGMGGLRLWVVI